MFLVIIQQLCDMTSTSIKATQTLCSHTHMPDCWKLFTNEIPKAHTVRNSENEMYIKYNGRNPYPHLQTAVKTLHIYWNNGF